LLITAPTESIGTFGYRRAPWFVVINGGARHSLHTALSKDVANQGGITTMDARDAPSNRTPARPTLRVTATQLKIAFPTTIVMQPDAMMAKVWASQSATRQDR
jgi:hypothetical protein